MPENVAMKLKEKVDINKKNNEMTVAVDGRIESWMINALVAWVVVWTSLGAYVAYHLFARELPEEQMIFFSVYLAFWLYFEFKSIQSLIFKLKGKEQIVFDASGLTYLRSVSRKTFNIPVSEIRGVKLVEEDRSFGSVYSKSFWIIGGERIEVLTDKATFKLGIQLDEREAKRLLDSLTRQWKRLK